MIVFTLFGGIEAVVWIEVAQLAIYLGGAVAVMVVLGRDVGFGEALAAGAAAGKLRVFDFSLDLTKTYNFWAGLIGGTFLTLSTHGTDQYLVQRYLCTDRPRSAAKALLASAAVVLVQFAMFLFIGVLLFAFYRTRYDGAAPVSAPDQVFPHFIAHHLPYLRTLPTAIIANIAGKTEAEFVEMAAKIGGAKGLAGLELNLS